MKINELPTPCYVIDERKLRKNLEILKKVKDDTGCKILLAQKAFSNFFEYPLIGQYLDGTTASGLFEAKLGYEKMGKENHVFAPAFKESEIGHIHVMEGEKEACSCGGHGCLEQVASATGIARTARRMLAADNRPSTLRSLKNISAKNVLDAAKAGDALALESLNKSCYYLGWALATISMVLDPQAFLIGGGVSKAGTFLTDIIKRYHDELSPMATKKADIVLAKLGNDAGIYGAAKLIIG